MSNQKSGATGGPPASGNAYGTGRQDDGEHAYGAGRQNDSENANAGSQDDSEDADGAGRQDDSENANAGSQDDSEDADGAGCQDDSENANAGSQDDSEDADGAGCQDDSEDADGAGCQNHGENANAGSQDDSEDTDGAGSQDDSKDADGAGRQDDSEDADGAGRQDDSENANAGSQDDSEDADGAARQNDSENANAGSQDDSEDADGAALQDDSENANAGTQDDSSDDKLTDDFAQRAQIDQTADRLQESGNFSQEETEEARRVAHGILDQGGNVEGLEDARRMMFAKGMPLVREMVRACCRRCPENKRKIFERRAKQMKIGGVPLGVVGCAEVKFREGGRDRSARLVLDKCGPGHNLSKEFQKLFPKIPESQHKDIKAYMSMLVYSGRCAWTLACREQYSFFGDLEKEVKKQDGGHEIDFASLKVDPRNTTLSLGRQWPDRVGIYVCLDDC